MHSFFVSNYFIFISNFPLRLTIVHHILHFASKIILKFFLITKGVNTPEN